MSAFNAHVVHDVLGDNGVPSFIADENMSAFLMGQTRVLIERKYLKKAIDILNSTDISDIFNPSEKE